MIGHPFQEDLSQLKDPELDQKLQEITKKYFYSPTFGKLSAIDTVRNFC
jgi:hypothetical protein